MPGFMNGIETFYEPFEEVLDSFHARIYERD